MRRHLARHDELTRLSNRQLFIERLGYAMAQARRQKTMVGVLFLGSFWGLLIVAGLAFALLRTGLRRLGARS